MDKIYKLQSELLESAIKSSSSDSDVVTIDLEDVIKRRELLGLSLTMWFIIVALAYSLTHHKVQMLN